MNANPPSRSRLLSLMPLGVGTADLESLTSYNLRLAAIHGVSSADMVCRILPGGQSATLGVSTRDSLLAKAGGSANGMSDLADAVASLTAEATHKSAEGLTMLPFAQTLATNRLMSEWLRWCPLCLEDSEHERLAWL